MQEIPGAGAFYLAYFQSLPVCQVLFLRLTSVFFVHVYIILIHLVIWAVTLLRLLACCQYFFLNGLKKFLKGELR